MPNKKGTRAASGSGSIRKVEKTVKGKKYVYWEGRITTGTNLGKGRPKVRTFSGKSQKEVLEKLQQVAVDIKNNEYIDPEKATVAEWADIWLENFCSDIKYRTLKTYRANVENHIKPGIGAVKLKDLTTPKVQKFYNELGKTGKTVTRKSKTTGKLEVTQEPLAPKTIKNIHSTFSKCLNDAIDAGSLRSNSTSRTKRPKVMKNEIVPLTDDQVKEFISELEKEEYKYLYRVYLFTGLRESEALGLTWDCLDTKKGVLKVYQQLQKRPLKDGGYVFAPTKGSKTRYITLPHFLIDTFADRKTEQENQKKEAKDAWIGYKDTKERKKSLIFTTSIGGPINPKVAWMHFKKIAARIDIPESRVHDLRHTYAVLSLQNGDDVKTVQQNLGHASAAFTLDVYGHVTDKMKDESASRMQNYIDSITEAKKPPEE